MVHVRGHLKRSRKAARGVIDLRVKVFGAVPEKEPGELRVAGGRL